jgi:hypothetical protein
VLNFVRRSQVKGFRAWVFGRAWRALVVGGLAGAMGAKAATLASGDVSLLDDLQQHTLVFFVEQSDPVTGLTRDRAPASGAESAAPASIAASGFALTTWCIADEHGWMPAGEALQRVKTTLRFVADHVDQEHGWFFHYVNPHTGRRMWKCEASTIDTALFLQGAICAREYFDDATVRELVDRIYARIDWQWALAGGSALSHGWWPESGFIPHRWDSYAEMLGLYLLGLGAPAHPLSPSAWHVWTRGPVVTYAGHTFMECAPLFTYQFSHAWFDFRGRRDDYADYWQNSVDATLAQREWCANRAHDFPLWSHELWGLTSSDSARGYKSWGGPFGSPDKPDGTVVPCAPGGSLPFAPQECLAALRQMRAVGGDRVWGRYGFADAFNPQTGWVSNDVLAIDAGITLVMAENLRSGLVWKNFMRAPEVRRGLKLAGFKSTRTPFQMVATAIGAIPNSLKRFARINFSPEHGASNN